MGGWFGLVVLVVVAKFVGLKSILYYSGDSSTLHRRGASTAASQARLVQASESV